MSDWTENKAGKASLYPLVRRWWAMAVYLAVCAAWVGWCLHDASAGMFWPALAVASLPVALQCVPNAPADARRVAVASGALFADESKGD